MLTLDQVLDVLAAVSASASVPLQNTQLRFRLFDQRIRQASARCLSRDFDTLGIVIHPSRSSMGNKEHRRAGDDAGLREQPLADAWSK